MVWESKAWSEVLTIQNGRNQKKVESPDGIYPIYGSGGEMGRANDYLCPEGTTIIGRKGSINNPLFVSEKFWNVDTAFGLIAGNELDKKYLYYFCKTYNFLKHNKATTLPSLTKADLLKIKIPLPPLDQQKKIAEILDSADAYRQKTKALLEKYDELAQSIFMDMFGDPVSNPMRWLNNNLEDCTTKITDGEHGTVKRTETGMLYLMARNVGDNGLILDDISYISKESHTKIYNRCNPEYGDLLLVCVGATIGRCCLTPKMEEFSLARSVALIKPSEILNSNFLLYQFKQKSFQHQIQNKRNTSAQAGLYTGQIKKLNVIIPPLKLQNVFSNKIELINHQKNIIVKQMELSDNLFNSLLQKAFYGELTN